VSLHKIIIIFYLLERADMKWHRYKQFGDSESLEEVLKDIDHAFGAKIENVLNNIHLENKWAL
jgi:hypothetical protein